MYFLQELSAIIAVFSGELHHLFAICRDHIQKRIFSQSDYVRLGRVILLIVLDSEK